MESLIVFCCLLFALPADAVNIQKRLHANQSNALAGEQINEELGASQPGTMVINNSAGRIGIQEWKTADKNAKILVSALWQSSCQGLQLMCGDLWTAIGGELC